ADAEDGYGWEKLYMERVCRHYTEDFGLETRVVRFHNIFGPLGTYDGGREKSPAAICRKVARAKDGDEIEVWGDGEQTRSFCYIDDCVEGIFRLMHSDFKNPLNIGSDRLVTINQMIDIISEIASKKSLTGQEFSQIAATMDRQKTFTLPQLLDVISAATRKRLQKKYLLDKPQGVRGRNS